MTFAARIAPSLLESIVGLDDERTPIAELCRRIGAEAERRGLTRPSYERVRELVHEIRRLRAIPPSTRALIAEIVFRGAEEPLPKAPPRVRERRARPSDPPRPGRLRGLLACAGALVVGACDRLRRQARAPD